MAAAMLLILAIGASSRADSSPENVPCVAVMPTEVVAKSSAEDRQTLAKMVDTLLAASLSEQKGLVVVEREVLDKILTEKVGLAAVAKISPDDVPKELRPFWSAGVLLCPVISEVPTGKGNQPDKGLPLLIEIEAVLAQTGQSLGATHSVAKWENGHWSISPSLETSLKTLWTELPGDLQQARAARYLEIAGRSSDQLFAATPMDGGRTGRHLASFVGSPRRDIASASSSGLDERGTSAASHGAFLAQGP